MSHSCIARFRVREEQLLHIRQVLKMRQAFIAHLCLAEHDLLQLPQPGNMRKSGVAYLGLHQAELPQCGQSTACGRSAFQQAAANNFERHAYLFYSALYKDTGVVTNIFKACEGAQDGGINFQDKVIVSYFAQFPIEQDIAKAYDDSWSDLLRLSCN
jgi:hypothetical protein